MRNLSCFVLLLFWAVSGYAQANSYLFLWAGDDAKTSNDFLAVLDADSKSPHYGQAVASVTVPGPSGTPHHTKLEMPEDGFLLANAFESGRTMLFDLREPLHPSLVTSFGDLDGYMHPHTYVRLPNGNVLATFQYHGGHERKSDGGGIVEFDERGHLIRSSSANVAGTFCNPRVRVGPFVAQDNPADTERPTGKDAVETAPGQSAATTVVNLDANTKLTPFNKIIIGKEKEVFDLTAKGDYAGWAGLLSDDALAVYDTGYASKAEVLKYIKGMSDFHGSMDQVRIMPIGKTAGLIIYRMTQGWTEQGKPMARQYYVSSLWVKRGEKWLSQFWQETDAANSQAQEDKTVQNQNNSATDDTKELLQIETDLLNAYVHRDLSVRDRYLSDDFVGVDVSGGVYSKQQDMQELKDGTFTLKSFRTEGVQVRFFGDSAIVTGRNSATSVYNGKEETGTIRFADTFHKRDGRWQMVYSQDTNVANTAIPEGNATEFPPRFVLYCEGKGRLGGYREQGQSCG